MTELVDPGLFDEDYLYFYETLLSPERSDAEAELIVRLTGLAPGSSVLDVPCGHGRIANRLAEQGMQVTGVDSSALMLNAARKDAAERGVEVSYVAGDMRSLEWESRFDLVLNWFTSFGYFDDRTNRAVLTGFRRALAPGGALVLDHQNRDRFLRYRGAMPPGRPLVWMTERGDDLLIDCIDYNAETGCSETERIIVRDGSVRRQRFSVRLFSLPELRDWLTEAGFTEVEAYGYDGGAFSIDSERLIVVARA